MEQDEKENFEKEASEAVKKRILDNLSSNRNWRSWGSWFSWGSPVGLGLFLISIGIFILLLHYSGIF
ncbi:MAG: hypothetical protein WC831_01815 [Parcubacteria group bacterium]